MAIFVDKNGKPTSSELSTYSEQLFFDKKNNNFYASGKEYRKPYQTIKLPGSGNYDYNNNVCLVKLGVINLNDTNYNGISGTFKFFDSEQRASKYSLNGSELYMSFRISTNNRVDAVENALYWKEFYGDMSDEKCVFVAQSASHDNNDPVTNSNNAGILTFGPDSTTNHSSSFEVWFRYKQQWSSIIIEWWPEYVSPGVTFDLITNPVLYTAPIGSPVIEIPYGGNTFTVDEFTNNICSHTSEYANNTMYNGTFVAFSYYKPSVNAINSIHNKINYSSRDSLYYLTFVDGTNGNRQTYTNSDITVNPSSNTISATNFKGTLLGNANTATALKNSASFNIYGAGTGVEQTFNGTQHVSIPITSLKESYLVWNDGKAIAGSVSPIDMAMSSVHNPNRLSFANPDGITIEWSRDGGNNWTDYGASNVDKIELVSNIGSLFYLGGRSTGSTANDRLRITLAAAAMGIYTQVKKLLINVSRNGASGAALKVEYCTNAAPTTWVSVGTYPLAGWSGWNSIPLSNLSSFGSADDQNKHSIRLTFSQTAPSSDADARPLQILSLCLFGDEGWVTPSNMARHNHIYNFDYLQNVTFPANLTASNINATNINATNINASNIYATNFEGTASKVNIKQNTSANSTYYLMLTNKNAGSTYTYVNSNLSFNPSTGTLTNKISTFNFNKSGDVPVFYPNKWLRIIKITIPSSYNWLDETIEIPVKFRWVSSLIYIDVHFYTYGDNNVYRISCKYKGNLLDEDAISKGTKFYCAYLNNEIEVWAYCPRQDNALSIYPIKYYEDIIIDLTHTTFNGTLSEFESNHNGFTVFEATPENVQVAYSPNYLSGFCYAISVVSQLPPSPDPNTLYLIV